MYSYVEQRLAEAKKEGELLLRSKTLANNQLRWVVKEKNRHGKTTWYFRRGRGERIRLPDPDAVGSKAFNQAYRKAMNGIREGGSNVRSLPPVVLTRKDGGVYFLRSGEAVKIGYTTNIVSRMASLKTGSADDTELLLVVPGTEQTERYFHQHFKSHRLRGEWFMLDGALAAFLATGKRSQE